MGKMNRLPIAKEIWAGLPKPALARKLVTQSRTGFHTTRMHRGQDISGKPLFVIETRNIFGAIDRFSDLYSEHFDNYHEAWAFYHDAKEQSKVEYDRYKYQFDERMKKLEETGQLSDKEKT